MTLRRQLAICAAGALALTGTGTALAAKGHRLAASSWSRADEPRGRAGHLSAAAAYLGLTPAALQADLEAGTTLAQVAAATSGKSVDGLVAALVAAEKTELDAAVAAGRITAAQEASIVATLQQRVTDLVNGLRPAGGHGPGDGFRP